MARQVLPLHQRKGDYVYIFFFSVFVLTSSLYAPLSLFNVPIRADSEWAFLRWAHGVAADTDTLIIDNPPWARVVNGADALFFSWFQVLLVLAIVRGWDWVRVPFFYYHACHLYGTVIYCTLAVYGERPVPGTAAMLAMNAPYAIVPCLFAVHRMRHAHPFTRAVDKKQR